MDLKEAKAWLRGERSTTNIMEQYPHETWQVRIEQADAALIQQAYWIVKAHAENLITEEVSDE